MSVASRPYWPAMMRRSLAASYCDLTVAEFEREIASGRLPVPVHRRLAEILDRTPRTDFAVLSPWQPASLRRKLQAWAKERGAKVVPHGLRKNAVNALLEAGCSSAETAAISGQTLQVIEYYAKLRDRTVLGQAAILRWEGKNGA